MKPNFLMLDWWMSAIHSLIMELGWWLPAWIWTSRESLLGQFRICLPQPNRLQRFTLFACVAEVLHNTVTAKQLQKNWWCWEKRMNMNLGVALVSIKQEKENNY